MKKSRIVLCFSAVGLAAVALLSSGCRSRQPAANLSKVSVLGNREILPPPYASPASARALSAPEVGPAPRVSGEPQLPSALTADDAFVPAVGGDVAAPLTPPSLEPVLTPAEPLPAVAPTAPSTLATPSAPKQAIAPKRTYKVQSGDSLSSIGYRYGVSWPRLAALNGMDGKSILKPGMVLRLPDDALDTPRPLPKKTATAASTGKAAPAKSERQSTIKKEPRPANGIYKVRSGDNLWVIARRFDCTTNEIRTLNNLTSDVLHVDQELKIPDVSGSSTAPAAVKGAEQTVKPTPVAPTPTLTPEAPAPSVTPKPVILETPGAAAGPAPAPQTPKPVVISPTGGLGTTPTTNVPATNILLTPPPVPLPLTPATTTTAEPKLIPHNVGAEETLQIVADMYSISISDIMRFNPGVRSDADLKGRTQIMVPVKAQ
ncbi:MAG TPA: LysM peptidoglycan-binding domain-containing protein [Lentisphaeria bacterium]|nr:LysM peptidoglycan-binding domain-containing protein [Lentisphaeria bacterium]